MFEAPLAFFLDPANRREHKLDWKGGMRRVYAFEVGTHYIWGATAAILVNLAERLTALMTRLPPQPWMTAPATLKLMAALGEARFVGGAVRNTLLGAARQRHRHRHAA